MKTFASSTACENNKYEFSNANYKWNDYILLLEANGNVEKATKKKLTTWIVTIWYVIAKTRT